ATNNGLTLVLAFNYGGRAEIVDASREFAQLVSEKKYKANQLDEKLFSKFLYQPDLPEPDLLIRTSGELRISNFLIWGLAYAELYFTEKYWPDFTKEDLVKAIIEYQKRQRRFGRI
ncbi:MAG: di-trans,poly-cis-decaprenylcistransferase, partial [Candidatus Omnitrophica bacterium]|nr:di-trans,poly-cis-decaprenylcistransferase [Candidatus Omnitrophota bacterium]